MNMPAGVLLPDHERRKSNKNIFRRSFLALMVQVCYAYSFLVNSKMFSLFSFSSIKIDNRGARVFSCELFAPLSGELQFNGTISFLLLFLFKGWTSFFSCLNTQGSAGRAQVLCQQRPAQERSMNIHAAICCHPVVKIE